MSKTIQHKRSSVAGNQPNASQIEVGELAINFPDRVIYTKDGSGVITELTRDIWREDTQPDSAQAGDLWFDGTSGDLSLYDGTNWGQTMVIDSSNVVEFTGGISEQYSAVTSSSNATSVDLHTATNFSHTLTENTTFSFSNPAASGKVSAFTVKVQQDASASGFTLTWPTSVDWPTATAPTLTATASAVDYFVFMTHDGGTTYYGFTAGQALA